MRASLLWELLEVFRSFWIQLVEKWICRFAAGIVLTNLYLKNLRFVNWKPRIEFTSWDIGSRELCQKFILWTEAAVSLNLTSDQQREHLSLFLFLWFLVLFWLFVVFVFPCDWSCCVWSEKKEFDVSMWESRVKQFSWHDSDPVLIRFATTRAALVFGVRGWRTRLPA